MKKTLLFVAILLVTLQARSQEEFHLFEKADSLYSEVLGEQREIWIQMPKFYDPSGNTRYPVVYLVDGHTQALALHAATFYYEGHYMPDMILVGISNAENRVRDLTPSEPKEPAGWLANMESGKADTFTGFLEEELIPYIDSILPTTPYRTLVGHSYGGLFVMNTLLKFPHLFRNYIAIDPSLTWDDQYILEIAPGWLEKNDYSGISLFTSLAAESLHMTDASVTMENLMDDTTDYTLFARSVVEFSTLLETNSEKSPRNMLKVYPEDIHGTILLSTMTDGLKWVFKWYQLEEFHAFNDFETPTWQLMELIDRRAEVLEENFGYFVPPFEEALLNVLGYMSMEQGKMDRARAIFEKNISYYPQSPNAYDSMADYFMANGDKKRAIRFLRMALEVSEDKALYQEKIDRAVAED